MAGLVAIVSLGSACAESPDLPLERPDLATTVWAPAPVAIDEAAALRVENGVEESAGSESTVVTSAAGRRAWVLSAVASGRFDRIEAWFAATLPRPSEAVLLRDLYYALAEYPHAGLALETARRLRAVSQSDTVVFGPARETVDAAAREAASIYVAALDTAYLAGLDVTEELRAVSTARLVAEDVDAGRSSAAAGTSADVSDPEALFTLGELALQHGDAHRARAYYMRARDRLGRADADDAARALLARVLVRLGAATEAAAVFEGLLRASPGLDDVRADYAAALLEWGERDRAAGVLGLDASAGVVAVIGGSGGARYAYGDAGAARRLDLLRVRWLADGGRHREAERVLDRLTRQFPADPDVLVARGAFDAEWGWFARSRAHAESIATNHAVR